MASSGNQNHHQQGEEAGGGGPFDMNKFFKPSNSQNPSNPLGPPTPSASYPPPTGTGPYSYPPQTTSPSYYHHHMPPFPQDQQQQQQLSNLHQHQHQHQQRSVSFPTPPLQPVPSAPPPPQNPTNGARLMALLSSPPPNFDYSYQPATPLPSAQPSSSSSEFLMPSNVPILPSLPPLHAIHAAITQPSLMSMPSSKLPKGRHLVGDRVFYDVDVRLQGEEQPQLEVTPITKYASDPGLILGRQIAVNKTYICYGLKLGAIRVLNINTALRSLLRGHTQRVTDMAFFTEDVHLLASASIDGRVYVWKIFEGLDEEEKSQIFGDVVLAIHINGDEGSICPRVCWHCHKQEILVVAIGKSVLRIDTTKAGKGVEFVAEEPLECYMDKLIGGIQLVGRHEGEVTDLSMCQWMTTRLVSASKDGTIKIWDDRKVMPLLVLRPHDGQPVDAAKFFAAPHRPDHIILITAGPLNQEMKLWVSSDEEGWLLPSDADSWRCTQTLELRSSSEPRNEEVFFNQVVGVSQAGLLLLANAKKNAIYAIHLEYGPSPAATRMDYIAEFTVTMPILSFTGTSDILPHGEHLVQLYCVQTQAIQQYALDLSQCLPPPMENLGVEKSESSVSRDAAECVPASEQSGSKYFEVPFSSPKPSDNQINVLESLPEIKLNRTRSTSDAATMQAITASSMDSNPPSVLSASSHADVISVASPPPLLSPRLSRKLSDQAVSDFSVDRQMDSMQTSSSSFPSTNDDNRSIQGNVSDIVNHPPVMFKRPPHLITPSEIMARSADTTRSAEKEKGEIEAKIQDVVFSNDMGNVEFEVKVVGEAGFAANVNELDPQIVADRKEKSFYCSQASDLGAECSALSSETENSRVEASLALPLRQPGQEEEDEDEDEYEDEDEDEANTNTGNAINDKEQKGKDSQASDASELLQGVVTGPSIPSVEAAFPELLAMREMICELVTTQKEMQKQMSVMAAVPVTKEGRRLETALGRSMEKVVKANYDALWARMQDDNAKREKLSRDRTPQNSVNKDLLAAMERTIKKELAAVGTNVARTITPVIEKIISSAISESFQRGVGDKAVNQLEKSVTSKLETTVARQIQAQFQTSGRQALQDGLKTALEASIIPAFEMSCKAIFEQVDAAFRKGMVEHTAASQRQIDSTHSQLAVALRDALNSASSLTQTLSGELADGQRQLLALAATGAHSNTGNSLVTQLSNGPLSGLHDKVEQPFDPTKELSRLISEHKYEEAFTAALQISDVFIVSWLCSQVDLQGILSTNPVPLSQGVLLSLLQQLACDITNDTARKLAWMTDVATCIIPHDPMIALHVRPILEQVYQILSHQRNHPSTSTPELSNIRVVMHVINSMLSTCK